MTPAKYGMAAAWILMVVLVVSAGTDAITDWPTDHPTLLSPLHATEARSGTWHQIGASR